MDAEDSHCYSMIKSITNVDWLFARSIESSAEAWRPLPIPPTI